MKPIANNCAFIDSQNVNLGVRELGWKLDFRKLRKYLGEKYAVTKAYLFLGYIRYNENLYRALHNAGYILIFKEVLWIKDGTIKGNVDAELVLHTMIQFHNYNKAVIMTGDGDLACLVQYLLTQGKLELLLVPDRERYSALLKKAARKKINFCNYLQSKLEYNEKNPLRTKP